MSNQLMKSSNQQIQQQFTVLQDSEGKFYRRGKYSAWASKQPETEAEMIELFNLLEGSDESVIGLKDCVNQVIAVQECYFNPYTTLDEDTGEEIDGVLSYIKDNNGQFYVTSSKTFYNTLIRCINMFGHRVNLQITSKKGQNGNIIGCAVKSLNK